MAIVDIHLEKIIEKVCRLSVNGTISLSNNRGIRLMNCMVNYMPRKAQAALIMHVRVVHIVHVNMASQWYTGT